MRQLPQHDLDHCDPEARDSVSSLGGEQLTGERSTWVDLRQREHVAGRALQHGHLRRLLRQCGDHRHGGGAAADHHYGLAGVIQVLGPVLGVCDGTGELLGAGEVGAMALVVGVVPGAEEDEPGAVGLVVPGGTTVGLHRPGVGRRIPVGGTNFGVEPDVLVDSVLVRRRSEVFADLLAPGHRLRASPRLPREAQGVHAGVATNTRVSEDVPGAADPCAPFQDDVAQARVALSDPMGRSDTRYARADHDDIEDLDTSARRCSGRILGNLGHRTLTSRVVVANALCSLWR